MKKWILAGLLPFLSAALLLYACYPDPPSEYEPNIIDYTVLPPITQTGANTFGCKVNGKVWVPRVEILSPYNDKSAQLHEKNGSGSAGFSCRILTSEIDNFLSVSFGPTYFKPATIYGNDVNTPKCIANFNLEAGKWYIMSPIDSLENWVEVSFIDTSQNIISGTFELSLRNIEYNNDILKITEGRFDLRYFPQ